MRLGIKIDNGNVSTHAQHHHPHRMIQCRSQTEAWAQGCSRALYAWNLKNVWREELRQDSAESQRTVAQIRDVCDTYGSARWCFTRVFTRNPLRGQLSQKIITAIILSINFKLISDGAQSSQVVFVLWLQRGGENNSMALTVMWFVL